MQIPQHLRGRMLVVDPHTGHQVMHVKACDPDPVKGWLEVYITTACPLDDQMHMIVVIDGVTTTRNYTFMVLTDTGTGAQMYMTTNVTCDFDVIDKDTGEVFYECRRGYPISQRFLDPSGVASEIQGVAQAAKDFAVEAAKAGLYAPQPAPI